MSGRPLISVIDDDDSVRESLESLVRSFGFAVEVFSSAEAFLNSDHLGDMRCLVLDVRLPGMNGLELQQSVELPVILESRNFHDGSRRCGGAHTSAKERRGRLPAQTVQRGIAVECDPDGAGYKW